MNVANHHRFSLRRRQAGFTLLEILLVLGLLVVVGSLSWPLFQGMLELAGLRSGADQVRIAMSETRVRAMSSGVTYQLECQLESRIFKISPTESEPDAAEVSDATSSDSTSTVSAIDERELPKGIKFTKADSADKRAAQAPMNNQIMDFSAASTSKIYFYPDGSTSTAEVQVTTDSNTSLIISLRGITGVALVIEPSSQNSSATTGGS